jgi:hypothetical protein
MHQVKEVFVVDSELILKTLSKLPDEVLLDQMLEYDEYEYLM